jgi:hypothetical protein
MMAIWPAGPPKLMNPSFSQKRNASASLGLAPTVGPPGASAAWLIAAASMPGASVAS